MSEREIELQVMCRECDELQTDVVCGTHIQWVVCDKCLVPKSDRWIIKYPAIQYLRGLIWALVIFAVILVVVS